MNAPYVVVYILVAGNTTLRFDQIVSDDNLHIQCINSKSNHRKMLLWPSKKRVLTLPTLPTLCQDPQKVYKYNQFRMSCILHNHAK